MVQEKTVKQTAGQKIGAESGMEKAETHKEYSLLQPHAHFPSIKPETVFTVGAVPVASTTLMLGVSVLLVAFLSYILVRNISAVPKTFQNIVELIYEAIEGLIEQLVGDKKRAFSAVPVLGSVMVFIGLSNFMGLVPLLGSITFNGHHMFRSATSDFNTTFALAVGSILIIQIIGFKENGIGYLGHFFKFKEVYTGFKKSIGEGMIAIVEFFVGLLELIGEFIRVISLSLRLFGNMFAGKVVMAIAIGSFAYVLPALWLGFEFLVALVQALVFTSLIAVYYAMVLKKEDGH
jgi:F-type H+-transporting ATPase subunit a